MLITATTISSSNSVKPALAWRRRIVLLIAFYRLGRGRNDLDGAALAR